MLAAGVGRRLSGGDDGHPPKALLRFDGRSLIERHVETLKACGIGELALVVGYRRELILAEIEAIGAGGFVRTLVNPDFRRGALVSLWAARELLAAGEDVLFMDADVLYDPLLIERLVGSAHGSCFLMDRGFEPGDEPVKLCLRDGVLVEFRKKLAPDLAYDTVGEWPGFLRMSPDIARRVARALQRYVDAGRLDEPYEEPMRDVLLADPAAFGVEDVTGVPWIEIDFPEDLARAEAEVMPRLRERALAQPYAAAPPRAARASQTR